MEPAARLNLVEGMYEPLLQLLMQRRPPQSMPQLHAQLLSPTFDGAPPVVAASAPLTNDSAQSLAQATVSFEPARGRLHLGSAVVCGVANHASLLSSEKRSAASRGAAASTAAAASGDVLVFSTSQLYELVQGAAGGAAAAGLLALTRRRAICAIARALCRSSIAHAHRHLQPSSHSRPCGGRYVRPGRAPRGRGGQVVASLHRSRRQTGTWRRREVRSRAR